MTDSDNRPDNRPVAACAAACVLAGAATVMWANTTLRGWHWPAGVLAGIGIAGAGAGLVVKHDLTGGDLAQGFGLLYEGANELLSADGGGKALAQQLIKVEALPPAFRLALETAIADSVNDTSWVDDLDSKSHIVAGASDSGKTYYMGAEIARFLERNQGKDFYLRICDTDYGKRGWRWMGLPLITADNPHGFVARKHEQILQLIEDAHNELERRAEAIALDSDTPLPPYKLVVDEYPALLSALETKGKADAAKLKAWVLNLLVRGHGFNVTLAVMGQSAAVGLMGLSEALKRQCFILAIRPGNVDEVKDVPDGGKLFARVQELMETPSGKRASVLYANNQARVVVIPDLSLPQIELAPRESPVTAWLAEHAEAIAEIKSGAMSLTQFWKQNMGGRRQSVNDEFYKALKEEISHG